MLLQDKVAIVTGGGAGIGAATCLHFAAEGAVVAVGDIVPESAAETYNKIITAGGQAMHGYLDVSSASSVDPFIAAVLERYGRVDILVNNAGTRVSSTSVLTCTESDWDKTFAINTKSIYLMSRAVIPSMIENKGGAIINVSSLQGLIGRKNRAAYAASKGAMNSVTRSMAVDHGRDGIRVNCIIPGPTMTPSLIRDIETAPDPEALRKSMENEQLLDRLGEPIDIARAIAFMASDQASWITAAMLRVDGGIGAL